MGNQNGIPKERWGEETLESMQREKERDAHLKNLEFKRTKSLRRSIAKRLNKRGKKKNPKDSGDSELDGGARPTTPSVPAAAPPQSSAPPPLPAPAKAPQSVNRSEKKVLVAGEPQPFPSHVQDSFPDSNHHTMDRLRKSFRSSVRRKKDKSQLPSKSDKGDKSDSSTTARQGSDGVESSKCRNWQTDEVAVRSGDCSYHVKYLGSVEVFESRGMAVCEEAIKVLKHSKRKNVRALLHVSGDGLRVVDDDTKGLIVDQTIEKVSFCAPDRNYERGFSYICRDGATRRWMCHGFIAVKESGERLSHAVGCAFAICLERKQKRDKECAVSMNFDSSTSSFTRLGSFRQASITERLQDPQVLKPGVEEPPVKETVVNPFAIERPHPTDLMLQRQTSFRGLAQLQSNSPFKRQLSLRISELPSHLERNNTSLKKFEALSTSGHDNDALFSNDEKAKKFGASPLPTVPENQPLTENESGNQFSSLPLDLLQPEVIHTDTASNKSASPAPCKKEAGPISFDNPWDLVPDQPLNVSVSNCDSSSGISSTSSSCVVKPCSVGGSRDAVGNGAVVERDNHSKWMEDITESLTSSICDKAASRRDPDNGDVTAMILDDPFDAEWAALAMRTSMDNSKNPFREEVQNQNANVQETFELQM